MLIGFVHSHQLALQSATDADCLVNRRDEAITDVDPFRSPNAVQLLVVLDRIEPVIWRRLVVPWTWDLGQLHLTIQAAFAWWNYHMHEFRIGGVAYGDPESNEWNDDTSARTFDETELRLLDFAREPDRSFSYVYDFGDCWEHTVTVEKLLSLEAVPRSATCVDGARARPPEDVGGTSGYEDFLSIMSDPSDPEHRSIKRWCGGHFDPAWFDLEVINKDVQRALRPEVKRRMHQPRPKRMLPTS